MRQTTEDLLREYPLVREDEGITAGYDDIRPLPHSPVQINDLSLYTDFPRHTRQYEDEIDKHLEELVAGRHSGVDDIGDYTEPIVRETHKLVSALPHNIYNSKEGETYQRLLTSSINKLVTQFEQLKAENAQLARQSQYLQDQVAELKLQVAQLRRQHHDEENRAQQTQLAASETAAKYRQEIDLLRTKLIKYKRLYDEQARLNVLPLSRSQPAPRPALPPKAPQSAASNLPSVRYDNDELRNTIKQILAELVPQPEEPKPRADEATSKAPTEPRKDLSAGSNADVASCERLIKDLVSTIRKNQTTNTTQENQTVSPTHPTTHTKAAKHESAPQEDRKLEVVVNCFFKDIKDANVQKQDATADPKEVADAPLEKVADGPNVATEVIKKDKPRCKQCHSEDVVECTEDLGSAPASDTVNLMGEYKWTI